MFLLLFIIEFILLFLLAKLLSRSLMRVFLRTTKSMKASIYLISLFFLPGVIVHELSHFLVAGVLFVKTGEIDILPKTVDGGLRLGSVQTEKTDFVRMALIGVAPVIIGSVIVFGTIYYIQNNSFNSLIAYLISFFVIFEVGNTMFSSKKDIEGSLVFFAFLALILLAILFFNPSTLTYLESLISSQNAQEIFKKGDLFLLMPLVMDIILIGFLRLVGGR